MGLFLKQKQDLVPQSSFFEYISWSPLVSADMVRFDYLDYIGIVKVCVTNGLSVRFTFISGVNNTSTSVGSSPLFASVSDEIGASAVNVVLNQVDGMRLALNVPLYFDYPVWTRSVWLRSTGVGSTSMHWQYITRGQPKQI